MQRLWAGIFEFEVGGFGVGGCRFGALKNAAYAPEADLDAWNLQVSWLNMSAAKSDNMSSCSLHPGKRFGHHTK
jgi:6-phosphogluconate dehydrogenase